MKPRFDSGTRCRGRFFLDEVRSEMGASALRHGRRKRPRWFRTSASKFAAPSGGEIFVENHPHKFPSSVRSDIKVGVRKDYAAPDGAFSFSGFGSTKMPRLRRLTKFTATIFRGAAHGRDSSATRPRRWCLQTENSASAIRRGRRKRPRWLGRGICDTS